MWDFFSSICDEINLVKQDVKDLIKLLHHIWSPGEGGPGTANQGQ